MTRTQTAAGPSNQTIEHRHRAEALVSFVQLRWFIRLRWVMILCSMGFLLIEQAALEGSIHRPLGLPLTLVTLMLANLCWIVLSRWLQARMDRQSYDYKEVVRLASMFANAQIAIDLLLLTAILRYTGGVENPMAVFYLFHMGIAPLLLRTWMAFLQGVWALVLYLLLVFGELFQWISPHYVFLPSVSSPMLYQQPEFVYAVAVIVGCGIFGVLYFTVRIAAQLDDREAALRQVNAALAASEAALKQLQHRKAQFMRTAAHQLKSPLAVVQTQVSLLRDGYVKPEAAGPTYEKIIRRCREALEQIGDLLTLARMQDSEPQYRREVESDVEIVIREGLERFGPLAEAKRLELSFNKETDQRCLVKADPRDMSDCIGNLIENAIKYTEGPGQVAVRLWLENDRICVSVRDTGMGIPPEAQSEVFEPYRRSRMVLEAGISGSGLGLSIVRSVVEQAGGTVELTSVVGEGSTFTLRFPRVG